jgi:hypothetical protein
LIPDAAISYWHCIQLNPDGAPLGSSWSTRWLGNDDKDNPQFKRERKSDKKETLTDTFYTHKKDE